MHRFFGTLLGFAILTGTPDVQSNSIGMKLALIPAGEFIMGSNQADDEMPVHRVNISKPFYDARSVESGDGNRALEGQQLHRRG